MAFAASVAKRADPTRARLWLVNDAERLRGLTTTLDALGMPGGFLCRLFHATQYNAGGVK